MSFEIHPATRRRRGIPYDRRGKKNPKWRGGKTISADGRVLIYSPDHPFPNWKNYVYRYRLKIEKKIGRYLKPTEDVHHKNGDPSDDRLCNLELLTHSEHMSLTNRISTWSKVHARCWLCFTRVKAHKARGLCVRCYSRYKRYLHYKRGKYAV